MNNLINLSAPRNYSELSENQLFDVAFLLMTGIPENSLWSKCFVNFTGLKPLGTVDQAAYFKLKGVKGIFSISLEEILFFSKKMKFLTKSYIGLNPIQHIGKFIPVESQFENVLFSQYLEAENFYQAYIFTKNDMHLASLMATLYYKKGETYNNDRTLKRSKHFLKSSQITKFISVMWFMGVKEFFAQKYKFLFSPDKSHNFDEDEDEEPQPPDMYAIIQNQMRALTDGDITKREAVLNSLTWDALEELNNKIREAKQMVNSKL